MTYADRVLGIDIGGANLKAADGNGAARTLPFALWKQPDRLVDALREVAASFAYDRVAVAMTGELCDCFATRREGVRHIVESATAFAGARAAVYWSTAGRFVTAGEATREFIESVQAANWHALASFAGRFSLGEPALLLDIGSTTTDVVPIVRGRACPNETTDCGRLASGELVYLGVERTPLCAVANAVRWKTRLHRTMAEWFATTGDAFRLTGDLAEDAACTATADGRPATRLHSAARIARTIGLDGATMSIDEATELAHQALENIVAIVRAAVQAVAKALPPPGLRRVIVAGQGEFLARRVVEAAFGKGVMAMVSLSERLGGAASTAACAHALAVLAYETESATWNRAAPP